MSLPFIWPQTSSEAGPGRLTEIASFRKSTIPHAEFQKVYLDIMQQVAKFPISRQNQSGIQEEDPEIFVLVADWTSAEEKDVFEPGEQYQSIKPAFGQLVNPERTDFQCHHIILPDTLPSTPEAGFSVVSRMRIAAQHHSTVAAAFEEFTSTLTPQDGCLYLAVAPSREDGEVVVCFAGFRAKEDAEKMNLNISHMKLKGVLDGVTGGEGVKYGVVLRKSI